VKPSNVCGSFTEKEFYCFNYLLIVNKLINPGQFSQIGSYHNDLPSMKEVHTAMLKDQFFFDPYNEKSPAKPLNLLTFRMKNPILSAFFVANRPFIKFAGKEVYSDS
jgi:hypothetical protein